MQVSPHGLAWLFLTITSCLVLLMSLATPEQVFTVACNRTLEVGVGVASAMGPDDVGTPLHRDMGVHVTRGVGSLHSMRLNCRPEVSVLRLA